MKKYFFVMLLIIYGTNLYSQDINKYLIAYWSFDNSDCRDYSGNNNHGTPINNPTYIDDGIIGKAIHFEGKGYYIPSTGNISSIGSHVLLPNIDYTKFNEVSVTMWVRFNDFSHWPSGEAYFFYGHHNNGWFGIFNHVFEYQMNGKLINSFAAGAKLWDNVVQTDFKESYKNSWAHYALTYSNNIVKGYINGEFIGQINQKMNVYGNMAALARHWWYYDNEERTSARFTGDMDEVKIYSKALTEEEIKQEIEPCHSWFAYDDFKSTFGLNIVGNAENQKPYIRLTSNDYDQSGAVWFERKIPTNNNFTTDFSFLFTGGLNAKFDDGSLPGADGIAFVIQNLSANALGWIGGDLGYNAFNNSIAVEYDLFKNTDENHLDPNGNHIALQIPVNGTVWTKHTKETTLAMNDSIPPILNSVKYYSRIEYNYNEKRLKVYLDTEMPFDTIVINASPIDIPALINDSKNLAYFGITSATGLAFENHFITSWNLCAKLSPTAIDEEEISPSVENVYPNPAFEELQIDLSGIIGEIEKIEIYDYLGVKKKEINQNAIISGLNKNFIKLNISDLAKGLYLIKIIKSNNQEVRKFVKM